MEKQRGVVFWPLWGPPIAVAAGIAVLSSLPAGVVPRVRWLHADKIVHFSEYVFLAYLLRRALAGRSSSLWQRAACVWAVVLAGLYATVDEWRQQFVPGRSPDLKDWMVDLSGILVAQALFWRIRHVRRGKS